MDLSRDVAGGGASSRFLGLIVVPGQHITKIEVEDQDP